jgi:hypothetical protein
MRHVPWEADYIQNQYVYEDKSEANDKLIELQGQEALSDDYYIKTVNVKKSENPENKLITLINNLKDLKENYNDFYKYILVTQSDNIEKIKRLLE